MCSLASLWFQLLREEILSKFLVYSQLESFENILGIKPYIFMANTKKA